MKNIFLMVLLFITPTLTFADDSKLELEKFAQDYFNIMVASQAPDATTHELDKYLSLLMDDVGHTHLPYDGDDSRLPDGKKAMRKGMMFYLGIHTEYKAELLNVFVFNDTAIAIRYKHSAKGIHPQSKQAISYTRTMMEVLEIENGKVAIIRKYHE